MSFFRSKLTKSEWANYMSSIDEGFSSTPIAKSLSRFQQAFETPTTTIDGTSLQIDPELLLVSITVKGSNFEYFGKINDKGEFIEDGEIKFSNGLTYAGSFHQSKFSSMGKFTWPNGDIAFGKFENGLIEESSKWKIVVSHEGTVYMGQILLTEKIKKLFSQYNNAPPTYHNKNSTVELDFSIQDFLKHGEGEMLFEKYNITYFGSFQKGSREGFGVMVFSDGSKYYGGFKKDCFDSTGCFYYPDGTIFLGEYKESKKSGRGTLYLPHGDRIEGIWDDETIKNALYVKGEVSKTSLTTLNILQQKLSRVLTSSPGYLRPEDQNAETIPTPKKWSLYFSIHKREWEKQVLEVRKLDKAEQVLEQLFEENSSCLKKFIQFFMATFQGIYSSATIHSKTSTVSIPFAIDDVNSFIIFIHQLIQKCFDEQKHKPKNLLEYVYNYIHKDIHSTLFPLYKACYADRDSQINSKLSLIRKDAVVAFGVEALYLPVGYPKEKPFLNCIQLLEKIDDAHTPQEKITLLAALRDSIIADVIKNRKENRQKQLGRKYNAKEEQKDKEFQPAVDDLTGPYSYVFAVANIQSHTALFKYVTDWKDDEVSCMPVIALIGFYEGFLDFIMEVDPYVKDEHGRLMSKFQLQQNSGGLSTVHNLRKRIDELEKKLEQSKKDAETVQTEHHRSTQAFEEKCQFFEKMISEPSESNQLKELLLIKEEENVKLQQQLLQKESLSMTSNIKELLQKQVEQMQEELYSKECKVTELEQVNQQLQNDLADKNAQFELQKTMQRKSNTVAGQQEDFADCIYVTYETEDTNEFVIEILVTGYEIEVNECENHMLEITLKDRFTTNPKAKLRYKRREILKLYVLIPQEYCISTWQLGQNVLRLSQITDLIL